LHGALISLQRRPATNVLLLALSALWPLPLINVIPGAIIVFIAIAYLQDDGLLLLVAVPVALLSLAGFGWIVWTSAGAVVRWMGIWRGPDAKTGGAATAIASRLKTQQITTS
jgi:hypothetical protein